MASLEAAGYFRVFLHPKPGAVPRICTGEARCNWTLKFLENP